MLSEKKQAANKVSMTDHKNMNGKTELQILWRTVNALGRIHRMFKGTLDGSDLKLSVGSYMFVILSILFCIPDTIQYNKLNKMMPLSQLQ